MTLLQSVFTYQPPIHEVGMQAFNDIRDVYGIWALKFDGRASKIVVDYDASRLKESDIAFMLRNAGIRLHDPTAGEDYFGGNGAPNTFHGHSRS
jgi:hypothetical protein